MRHAPLGLRFAAGLILLCLSQAHAFEFRSGQTMTLPAGEVIEDDLYVAATEVHIAGEVQGDVLATGSTVTISGRVLGDVTAAARVIHISGAVEDDARLAGATLTLEGSRIGGDVVAAGYSLDLEPGSVVSGDLSFAGRQARLAGEILGDAVTASEGLVLSGRIGGNLEADVGAVGGPTVPSWTVGLPPVPAVPSGFSLREEGVVEGDLVLRTPEPVDVDEARVAGEVEVDLAEGDAEATGWLLRFLRRYVSLALVGLLLLWLAPALLAGAARALEGRPLTSLGVGALVLVGVPVALLVGLGLVILLAVVLSLATLGGLAGMAVLLGLALLLLGGALFVLVLAYLAQALVAYAGGRWLLGRAAPERKRNAVAAFLLGLLPIVLLSLVPGLGWLVALAVVLLGAGALWHLWRSRPRPPGAAPVSPA